MNNRHRGAWLTLGTLEWIVVGGGAQFTSDVSGATSIRRERRAVEGWRKELDNIITWLLPPGSFLHESGSPPSAFMCADVDAPVGSGCARDLGRGSGGSTRTVTRRRHDWVPLLGATRSPGDPCVRRVTDMRRRNMPLGRIVAAHPFGAMDVVYS